MVGLLRANFAIFMEKRMLYFHITNIKVFPCNPFLWQMQASIDTKASQNLTLSYGLDSGRRTR